MKQKTPKHFKRYVADFETCVWLEDETYVWAFAICDIYNDKNIIIGNNIEDFFRSCYELQNPTIYFHNLKFDGSFILNYLLNNGYTHIKNKKERHNKSFTTLITDTGQFFSIEVYFKVKNKKVKKVTFLDSLKILPFSVDKIAKDFNLPLKKLEIDYTEIRDEFHQLTKEEIAYIKNDVLIVAKALRIMFDEGLTKMTTASNAMFDYKNIITSNRFLHFFPELENDIDKFIRKSYKRGFYFFKFPI